MEILRMLWTHAGIGLSEAQNYLGRPIGYTTIQTRLNRMVEKGLVTRSSKRPANYRAAIKPEKVSARLLDLLLDHVSGGNVVPLVAHLMKERSLSAKDIAELKRLIAEAERRCQNNSSEEHTS
ncbi:MAG: BlaI/MecI/CopY family transcriptional regulator [Planctomycetes bacterium]|nr:BlaI/MecI/CopY family transcriptional regulator [Planctomycetota bacterium]